MLELPFPWQQGEHLAIVGENGTGKTTLADHILQARRFTIATRTKADDTPLVGRKVKTMREVERDQRSERFLLQPDLGDINAQRDELARMFRYTWDKSDTKGGWTVYVDEVFYVDQMLKLGPYINRLATQGRSKKLTGVFGMQRPVGQTRYVLTESRHVITFALDGRDARTFGEATMDSLREHVQALGRYEFLWYYRPERTFAIGTFDIKAKKIRLLTAAGARPETSRGR